MAQSQSIMDLAHDLDLLFPNGCGSVSSMDVGIQMRKNKIQELETKYGTVQKGYERILKDLEQTRDRRHMLKEYYKKVKNILHETTAISQTEQDSWSELNSTLQISGTSDARYSLLVRLMTSSAVSHRNDQNDFGSYRNNIVRHSVSNEKY